MTNIVPSSPCIALFKDGKPAHVLERRHIERMSALDIANNLTAAYNQHCSRKGPSVPKDVFDSNESVEVCGSSLTRVS